MKAKKIPTLSLRECTVLRDLCDRRIVHLSKVIDQCAGSLYPTIYARQIKEIRELFERLTGHPLDTEGVDYGT